MSYSFGVRAPTKEEALTQVKDELATVAQQFPYHALDRTAATEAATAVLDVLEEPAEEEDVAMSVTGDIRTAGKAVTYCAVSIVGSIVTRVPA